MPPRDEHLHATAEGVCRDRDTVLPIVNLRIIVTGGAAPRNLQMTLGALVGEPQRKLDLPVRALRGRDGSRSADSGCRIG